MPRKLIFLVMQICVGCAFGGLNEMEWAQDIEPAAPPAFIADAGRFASVHEDWTTPDLKKGDLHPIPAVVSTLEDSPDHITQLIRVQWRAADPIDLYVIKPKGVVKPPVIMWLYGFPAETDFLKKENFHKALTKGGFAGVAFMTALTGHRFHDRGMNTWFVSELQESLATSAHDVQMVLDYLGAHSDFDMSRVGVFGQGSGGTIAILAAAVDSRIKVLDALDPWGDWPDWLTKSTVIKEDERPAYTRQEFLQKVAPLDPIIWLPKMQSTGFRLQTAAFNTATPQLCKEKIKSAAPKGTTKIDYDQAEQLAEAAADGKLLDWMKSKLTAAQARSE